MVKQDRNSRKTSHSPHTTGFCQVWGIKLSNRHTVLSLGLFWQPEILSQILLVRSLFESFWLLLFMVLLLLPKLAGEGYHRNEKTAIVYSLVHDRNTEKQRTSHRIVQPHCHEGTTTVVNRVGSSVDVARHHHMPQTREDSEHDISHCTKGSTFGHW